MGVLSLSFLAWAGRRRRRRGESETFTEIIWDGGRIARRVNRNENKPQLEGACKIKCRLQKRKEEEEESKRVFSRASKFEFMKFQQGLIRRKGTDFWFDLILVAMYRVSEIEW